jgi:hypothetical protein
MTTFQFDECSTYLEYISKCNKAPVGATEAKRHERKHRGLPDPDVLAIHMKGNSVFITFDGRMVDEHGTHIPTLNPGIIIIGHSPAYSFTMTHVFACKILEDFKVNFPEWHTISWRNSIVKMTEVSIEIGYNTTSGFVSQFYEFFKESGWQDSLKSFLTQNKNMSLEL